MIVVVSDANLLRLRDELEAAMPEGTQVRWATDLSRAATEGLLADADVLVGPAFTAEAAAAAPNLLLVQVAGAGLDGIDRGALGGVRLANTFHHEDAMAEYALWAAIGLRRGLPGVDRALRADRWESPAMDLALPLPAGLSGVRVGLFGFGHIGERTWRAFAHFGATGAAVTGRGDVDAGAHGLAWAGGPEELRRLCVESDVLVCCVPLTQATRGAIGAAELDALGSDGVLINMARGPVVDEEALYGALRDGRLGGAAIDVWYSYPAGSTVGAPSRFPFRDQPNVLMTPHISGVALGTFRGRVRDIAANVAALAGGEPLRNQIEP